MQKTTFVVSEMSFILMSNQALPIPKSLASLFLSAPGHVSRSLPENNDVVFLACQQI
jgi:hypothetical protein